MLMFDFNSTFSRGINKGGQLMLLNVLWLVGCLPLISIGASTTALHEVAIKMARNEESYIIKDYLISFRNHFVIATRLWILTLLAGFIIFQDYRYFDMMNSGVGKVCCGLLGFLLGIMVIAVVSVLTQDENSLIGTLRKAMKLLFNHLPSFVMLMLMNLVVGYGIYVSVPFMIFILFLGESAIAYASAFLINHIMMESSNVRVAK